MPKGHAKGKQLEIVKTHGHLCENSVAGGAAVQLHHATDRLDRFEDLRGAMRRCYLAFDGGKIAKDELAARVGTLERLVKAKTAETNAEALQRLAEAPFMGLMIVAPNQQQE